jgi:pteridine reductase
MASSRPDTPLAGATALVTGAARRVGATLVRTFHAAGANIVLHHRRSRAEATALANELNAARRGSVVLAQGDLLDLAFLPRLIEETKRAFGQLDVLVNNASSFYPTPIGNVDEKVWDDLVGTNLKAPLFLSQAGAPLLRERRGLILNLADIHGMRPLARYPVYSTAKAGLIMLTKALARELAPEVRVNAIAPGPVLWPEASDRELQEKIIASTLLKRPGSPQDIARAALFFATEAPYATGQVLAIDGGRSV